LENALRLESARPASRPRSGVCPGASRWRPPPPAA